MEKRIEVFRVRMSDLPKATGWMNYSGDFFHSRVTDVHIDGETALVTVELDGYYPYITNQWEELYITEDEF